MLWQVLNIAYLIVWSVLLVQCLHRRRFYPIFGEGWGTKGFWLLTFVFFNPLLTLLYFVFGFLLRPAKDQEMPSVSFASVVAVACVAVVLALFELPLGGRETGPVTLTSESGPKEPNEQGGSFHCFEAQAGVTQSKSNVQTLSSTAATGSGRVSLENIMLICRNPNPLLDRAAREFQKLLVALPYVDKVTYYPFGTKPQKGKPLPSVFVTIDITKFDEKILLRSRHIKATIEWQAATSLLAGLSHITGADVPPVVQFNIESQLDHESQTVGIESRAARYKLEAKGIAGEMIKSIGKQFDNLLDKHGRLPITPEVLYGTYQEPPELPFFKACSAEQIISGNGLLENNHTVWCIAEQRDIEEALPAYRDELAKAGWTEESLDKSSLRMRKENEHVYVYQPRSRDPQTAAMVWANENTRLSGSPVVVHYESYLNAEQIKKAMDVLLNSDVQFETLLVFEQYMRTPEQRERLKSIIERSPVQTLSGYLVLANLWADDGEKQKARDALLHARAMERAEKSHNARSQEIKSLATRLGDETLSEVPLTEEILLEVGFANSEKITEPLETERGLNEPVLFYRRLDGGELQTLALRVVRSLEQSASAPYRLLNVQKHRGSSNVSETDGRLRADGVWVSESLLSDFGGDGKLAQCRIESLGGNRFAFTITP